MILIGSNINPENQKLLDRYMMICKNKGLTDMSIKGFNVDLRVYMKFLDKKRIEDTNHIDIEDFFCYCLEVRNNSDQALARKYTSLNCFYSNMIKREYLNMKNPLDKIDKIKVRKKQREHLSKNEMDIVFKYLEDTVNKRDLAIFSLLFSSGIRLSELYQLDRAEIDFETRRFKVLGKGDKERTCIFDEYAKRNILKYLDTRIDDLKPLFISRERNRLSKKAIQDLVRNNVKRAGLNKNISPHIIRHTAAMHYLKEKEMPLNLIQQILGHSSISTTQIYAHNNMDDVEQFLEKLV